LSQCVDDLHIDICLGYKSVIKMGGFSGKFKPLPRISWRLCWGWHIVSPTASQKNQKKSKIIATGCRTGVFYSCETV